MLAHTGLESTWPPDKLCTSGCGVCAKFVPFKTTTPIV